MNIEELLRSLGRSDWAPIGTPQPETKANTITGQYEPTGRSFVTVRDPKGNTQRLIVRPQQGQVETQAGPQQAQTGWTLEEIEPVTAVPKSSTGAAAQIQGGSQYGVYVFDDNGNIVRSIPPNADEEQKKAIENQNAAMLRNERQRNFDTSGTYATTAEVQQMQLDARAQNLSEQEFQQKVREFNQTQRQKDRELGIAEAKAPGEIAYTAAQTGQAISSTGLTNAQVEALVAKTPAEIEEMVGRAQLTREQANEIRQRMQQPKIQALGEGPTYGVMAPTGEITEQYRAGYVPKTQAEIAARTGQIAALANAKKAEVMAKVDAIADPNAKAAAQEQALKEFNAWYDQNVQPQIGALQAATEEAQFTRAKDIASEQRQAYQQALAAGTGATQAFTAAAPYRVGPNYAKSVEDALNARMKMAGVQGVDFTGSVGWKGPDVEQQRQQAVNEALKNISPLAAQQAGAPLPNYQGINPAEALARTNYMGGFAPTAGPSAAPAAPAPAGVGGPPTAMPLGAISANPMLAAQQAANRQAAGRQLTAATAQAGLPAIGSNPMQAAMEAYQAQQAAAAVVPAPAPSQPWGSSDYQGIRRAAPVVAPPVPTPAVPYSDAAARMASGLGAGGVGPTGPMPEPWAPAYAGEMGPAYTLNSVQGSAGQPYGQFGEPSVSGLGTMGQSYTSGRVGPGGVNVEGLPYETFGPYVPSDYIYRPGQPY